MSSKYKGYNFLSSHGKYYIDLSDERTVAKLTPKQRFYMREFEKMYRADLAEEDIHYFFNKPDVIKQEIIYKQRRIFSGQAYRNSQRTYFENYVTGLRNNGAFSIAHLLERVYKMKRGSKKRDSLIGYLQDLDLHYGRTMEEKSQLSSTTINDTISYSAEKLIKWALNEGIEILDKQFTLKDVRELMDTGYIDDNLLLGLRSQMVRTGKSNKTELATINSWLGLKENDYSDDYEYDLTIDED